MNNCIRAIVSAAFGTYGKRLNAKPPTNIDKRKVKCLKCGADFVLNEQHECQSETAIDHVLALIIVLIVVIVVMVGIYVVNH